MKWGVPECAFCCWAPLAASNTSWFASGEGGPNVSKFVPKITFWANLGVLLAQNCGQNCSKSKLLHFWAPPSGQKHVEGSLRGGGPECLKNCSKNHFFSRSRCIAGPDFWWKLIPNEASSLLGPPLPARNTSKVASGLLLGCSWAAPGCAWAAPGCSWAAPGRLLAAPGWPSPSPGLLLGCSWAGPGLLLGCSWLLLACAWWLSGCSWASPGGSWAAPGLLLAAPGLLLAAAGCLWLLLGCSWAPFHQAGETLKKPTPVWAQAVVCSCGGIYTTQWAMGEIAYYC